MNQTIAIAAIAHKMMDGIYQFVGNDHVWNRYLIVQRNTLCCMGTIPKTISMLAMVEDTGAS